LPQKVSVAERQRYVAGAVLCTGNLYVGLFNITDALQEVLVDFVLPALKANATISDLWMNAHF